LNNTDPAIGQACLLKERGQEWIPYDSVKAKEALVKFDGNWLKLFYALSRLVFVTLPLRS